MAARVIVVDDNPDFLEFMSTLLSGEGFDVHLLEESREATHQIHSLQPDVVILDLAMPDKTGWAVLEELRSIDELASLPVIVCTAAVFEVQRNRVILDKWRARIITKPFDATVLLQTIGEAVGSRQRNPLP